MKLAINELKDRLDILSNNERVYRNEGEPIQANHNEEICQDLRKAIFLLEMVEKAYGN